MIGQQEVDVKIVIYTFICTNCVFAWGTDKMATIHHINYTFVSNANPTNTHTHM